MMEDKDIMVPRQRGNRDPLAREALFINGAQDTSQYHLIFRLGATPVIIEKHPRESS
jgi:hypothetical protein